MPISGSADYTEEHWRRVQRVLVRAVERANMTPKLVWENPEVDVIHAKILQNIYESDVIVCDVSSLNANVMLELGLRLSTKRPTIVITDAVKKPPFDISVYQYTSYQRDLEYNALDSFIEELSQKILQVYDAYKQGKYKSFVENFVFEVVEPTQVTVPAEEALREKVDAISRQLSRIEARIPDKERTSNRPRLTTLEFSKPLNESEVALCSKELSMNPDILRVEVDTSGFGAKIRVWYDATMPSKRIEQLKSWAEVVVDKYDDIPF